MKDDGNKIFYKKSQWAYMSIYPRSGTRELQRFICLKYYNALKWLSTFTVGLNAAENTDYIKKFFK